MIVLSWLACEAPDGPAGEGPLLTEVLSAPADTGTGYGDVARATNGVRGGGPTQGSTDVFAIGAELVLGTGGVAIVDGEGPELVVFENPFLVAGGGESSFLEAVVVEVSPDGDAFVAFPHGLDGDLDDPAAWTGFAGITPVNLNAQTYPVDPFGETAGGDVFDLQDLDPGDPVTERILADGFVAVRLTSATDWEDPATGEPFPEVTAANGPDIDGVAVRW